MLTQEKLHGLAFPIIKVRFIGAGENSRGGIINANGETIDKGDHWSASIVHDNKQKRISRPYSHWGSGAVKALPVARELWKKVLDANPLTVDTIDKYIFIPVNLSDDTYGFVPVENYIINGRKYF